MKKVHIVSGVHFSSYNKAIKEISRLSGKPLPTKSLSIGSKPGAFSQMLGLQVYYIDNKEVSKEQFEEELNGSCYPVKVEIGHNEHHYITTFESGYTIETFKLH